MRKKIIVPAILLLLLAGILLIRLGHRPQSSPDPASAPSVLTGPASSATTAQQTEAPTPSSTPQQTGASFAPIHYTTDNSKPVKAKKDDKLKLTGKKVVIRSDGDDDYPLYMGCFYVIQKDGSVDKYPHRTDSIYSPYQTKNWLYYYTMDDSDDLVTTLHRVPIQQQGEKTKVRLEEREQLKKLDIDEFIYGTDQYVICTIGNNLIKYNIKSKKSQCIDPDPVPDETSDIYIEWEPFCDFFENPIISKNGDIYLKKLTEDDNMSSVAFYKFNTVTFKKTKLSDRTNAVFSDPSGQIVIMESDEKWNYAYYPGTGKRIRCGQNMMDEWGTDDTLNDFDEDEDDEDYEDEDDEDDEDDLNDSEYDKDYGDMSAANRDLVGWIREKNPWSYQEKNGHFSCVNHFVYNDRMYVKVTFRWKDAVEIEKDEADGYGGEYAQMLFSYSLKNYKGIRPETEINRIMQKYSSRTYQDVEDSMYYHYTETGDFSFLFKDVLVFEYDDFYVLYHVGTGAYRKIEGKNKDVLYLNELHEE